MSLQAWVDESGDRGQGTYLTLGGLIGEDTHWTSFADEWRAELQTTPALPYFSASDAATLGESFWRWKPHERDAKVRRLARILGKYPFTLFHHSVELAAFERYMPKVSFTKKGPHQRRFNTFMGSPYFLCLHNVCSIVSLESRGRAERCEIVFDEKANMQPRVDEWYPIYRQSLSAEDERVMPLRLDFKDDRTYTPLQAADLVAWMTRTELSGRVNPLARAWHDLRRLPRSEWSRVLTADLFEHILTNDIEVTQDQATYKELVTEYVGITFAN